MTFKLITYRYFRELIRYLLDIDLTEIMATSTDYDELEYIWTEWHNVAGKPIRDQYLEFVSLNNKAADLNGTSRSIFLAFHQFIQ